jgi:XTP/dITP diphosphohydrolase
MTTLLIATRNEHKVQEISQILGGDYRCLTMRDFPGAPVVVEDAETFAGNASKKVLSLGEWLVKNPGPKLKTVAAEGPLYIVADDSGLEVDALAGAPGVRSARFAAGDAPGTANSSDSANNAKLLQLLETTPAQQRAARFRCVLAVLRLILSSASPGQVFLFDGVCEGSISRTASGGGGFGYDPLFVPAGCAQSFAELGDKIKNELSHRARALAQLKQFLVIRAEEHRLGAQLS